MKKVLFTATVDSHIKAFHVPYLKYFKDNGYEVHVATNGTEMFDYCDKKIVIPFERNPFKLDNLKALKLLRKLIDEEKYSIIHTHTPMGSVVTRLAALNSRKENDTRVIYTAHGFHFYKGAPLKNWIMYYPVEKLLSKYTDTLITINNEDYELAKKKFKKCNDIEYIPGVGIDESKFDFEISDNEKHELRDSLDLKDDDFIMIYPAELCDNKNQEWLISLMTELVNKHNNIHLLLPGRDSLNGKLQELVKKLNLENNIHFLGFRTDIPKLLTISNLSLSASKREGLPLNIMEALFVGVPVLATDCRGNRDLVENGINGYIVNQNDSITMVEIIDKIYNGELFSKVSLDDKFLLENTMSNMEDVYEKKY